MEYPEYLHHRVNELLSHQLEATIAERAYWEKKLEHELLEHELRCCKARSNEEGRQIL